MPDASRISMLTKLRSDNANYSLTVCVIIRIFSISVNRYYKVSHSFCRNPTKTLSSVTRIGRFTSMPSVESSSSCSSSDISGRRSFSFISLYSIPLVLKNRFSGKPLLSYHACSSSFVGFSVLISPTVRFWQLTVMR